MEEMREPPEPVAAVRSRRRPPRKRAAPIVPPGLSEELETILAAHHEAIASQIEQSVRALQRSTASLVSELAPDEESVSPEDTAHNLLAHVDERYQGLTLRVERLEGALRQLVQTLKQMNAGTTGRQEELTKRFEELSAVVREASARQRHDLADFTKRTGQGLAKVVARAGEGLARAARQQEVLLDEKLEQMLEAVESLMPTMPAPPRWTPPANGSSAPADRAATTFVERLRAAEGRLARVSGDLAGWDPFSGSSPPERPPEPPTSQAVEEASGEERPAS
jgi:hypothetical protein